MKILKGIFYYSGFEYIYRKAIPVRVATPTTGLPTLPLWLIGIYIVFFGIASQRYENRVDIIENRANSIFSQLSAGATTSALSRISVVQNYPCPVKPRIFHPDSVFSSIFGKDALYTEMVKLLKETIEDWKDILDHVNLKGADLVGADLVEADLVEADLEGAKLKGAHLERANLVGAKLMGANLEGANLNGANLSSAHLVGALNLTIGQLSKVKHLYKAKLDPELMEQIKKDYPQLLEKSSLFIEDR